MVSREILKSYLLEQGGVVSSQALVRHFQWFLKGQDENKQVFKKLLTELTDVKYEEGTNSRLLELKPGYKVDENRSDNRQEPNKPRKIDERRQVSRRETNARKAEAQKEALEKESGMRTATKVNTPLVRTASMASTVSAINMFNNTAKPRPVENRLPETEDRMRTDSRTSLTDSDPRSGTMDSRQSDEARDDMEMESGCSNFSLELSEKEWMVRSAVGDCNTLSRLLLQDRNFALFKDFVSGYTGLHWACKLGRPDMAKIMLECGADVNARSSSGQTPLHLAAQCGYLELVALLVEHHKANIRIRDYSGRRPIQYASHEASPQLRFWLTPKDDQLHKYADKISQQLAQQRKFSMKSYSLNSDMRDDNSPIRRPTLNAAWKKMMGPTSFKASFNSKSKLKNNLKTSDPHKDFTVKKTESIPPSSNNKESNDRPRSKTLPPGIKTAVLYL